MNKDVLIYKPKVIDITRLKTKISTILSREDNIYKNSTPLDELKKVKPSNIINMFNNINNKLDNINKIISSNINKKNNDITPSQYKSAVDNNNFNIIDSYESENFDSIDGDINLDLYYPCKKLYEDINDLKDFYIQQNYGGIKDSYNDIDQYNLLKLEEAELEDGSVNYSSIYADVLINNIIDNYTSSYDGIIDNIQYLLEDKPESKYVKTDTNDILINNIFSSKLNINKNDKFKLRNFLSSNAKSNIVSSMYDKKSDYISTMSSVSDILKIEDKKIKSLLAESSKQLRNSFRDSIIDSHRILLQEQMLVEDFVNSTSEKQYIRDYYNITD